MLVLDKIFLSLSRFLGILIYFDESSSADSVLTSVADFEERFFGDVPQFNVTDIYDSTFVPEGIAQLLIQNFFNFFVNTMFWLTYLPLSERIDPIFDPENLNATLDSFVPVPQFNVSNIYIQTFEPDWIGVQLLQNFFNWFTSTVMFFPFLLFYDRLTPVFAPENNLNRLNIENERFETEILMTVSKKLTELLRNFAYIPSGIQW